MPALGVVQVAALFIGGIIISISLLLGIEQAGGGIYLLTQLVAIVIFVIRIGPRAMRTDWAGADPARHFAVASIWAVAALILFMYIVFTFITAADPDNALPFNVLIASDHAVYLGVITNVVLGLLSVLFLRGRAPAWVAQLIFWGVNLGLAVFVVGLLVDASEIKRIGAPLMGVTLLLALALLAARMWGTTPDASRLEEGERAA